MAEEPKENRNITKITGQELFVEQPLYSSFQFTDVTGQNKLYAIISSQISIDCYCPDCAQDSVFVTAPVKMALPEYAWRPEDMVFTREFFCTRNMNHHAHFVFRVSGRYITKIGQFPSLADLAVARLRSYKNVLEAEDLRELSRAVGLAAHGIGIGSFVYLRRIFERLIEEAHNREKVNAGWDETEYQKARMDEKIEMLSSQLPPFLVEHRKIYAILSKGIHTLSEEECLEVFEVLRVGIGLILEQKAAVERQKQALAQVGSKVKLLHQKLAAQS